MARWGAIIICFGYIAGLLSTGIDVGQSQLATSYALLGLCLGCSFWVPQQWRLGPTRYQWLLAGTIIVVGQTP